MKGKLTLSDERSFSTVTAAHKTNAVSYTDRVCLYAINIIKDNLKTNQVFRKIKLI